MKKLLTLTTILTLLLLSACTTPDTANTNTPSKDSITEMVNQHAQAWATGDTELLASLLHDDAIFAYPGRRLNKQETIEDLEYFRDHFKDTEVYINKIILDGSDLAVEWQFATTKIETGERQVVSDAIIATIKDGQFLSWKEYLDGRVKLLQATGELHLEEGDEPFPWPEKTELYGKDQQQL